MSSSIGLRPAVFARHGDARRMNDVGLNAPRGEPARQPEAVVSGLEGDGDTRDPVAFLLGLRPPAAQQLQQRMLIDREFLQRLTLNTRSNASDKPARLAHLDHRDQRRVHIQRVETPAEIVDSLGFAFRHWGSIGLRSVQRWIRLPAAAHSILMAASTASGCLRRDQPAPPGGGAHSRSVRDGCLMSHGGADCRTLDEGEYCAPRLGLRLDRRQRSGSSHAGVAKKPRTWRCRKRGRRNRGTHGRPPAALADGRSGGDSGWPPLRGSEDLGGLSWRFSRGSRLSSCAPISSDHPLRIQHCAATARTSSCSIVPPARTRAPAPAASSRARTSSTMCRRNSGVGFLVSHHGYLKRKSFRVHEKRGNFSSILRLRLNLYQVSIRGLVKSRQASFTRRSSRKRRAPVVRCSTKPWSVRFFGQTPAHRPSRYTIAWNGRAHNKSAKTACRHYWYWMSGFGSSNAQNSATPNSVETAATAASVPAGSLQRVQNDWRASALIGASVFNEHSQRVATIRDLLITDDGRIDRVVLTITQRRKVVAIAFVQLQFLPSQQFDTPVLAVRGRMSRAVGVAHAERKPYGIMLPGVTRESLAQMEGFDLVP